MMVHSGAPSAVSLLEAAMRAAVEAKAPRRTVAATAAAVATALFTVRGDSVPDGRGSPDASLHRKKKRSARKKRNKPADSARAEVMPNQDEMPAVDPLRAGPAPMEPVATFITEPTPPVVPPRLDRNVLAQMGSSAAPLPPNTPGSSRSLSSASAFSVQSWQKSLGISSPKKKSSSATSMAVPSSPGSLVSGANSARPPGTPKTKKKGGR